MQFDNIAAILLYVLPGFLAWEIYYSYFPAKKKSDFGEIAWSIIISIALYTIVKITDSKLKLNLFQDGSVFPRVRTIIILFILGAIFGAILIGIRTLRFYCANRFLTLSFVKPQEKSTWAAINSKKESSWACIKTTDGTMYLGYISLWKYDPNDTEYDLLLSQARKVDENLDTIYEISGEGVYIRSQNITTIEFYSGV
jgi:hypothetical protein